MGFVWNYLTDGDLGHTLVQVSVNDLLMLVLFAPIVKFVVAGASNLIIPFNLHFAACAHCRWLLGGLVVFRELLPMPAPRLSTVTPFCTTMSGRCCPT